jgi:RNA polymerase sigma factor (sigma-70 family)
MRMVIPVMESPRPPRRDRALVSAARDGDRAAMDRLLAEYQPDVRRFALRTCRTSEDADDAVQHTLVQLSTQLGSFQGLSRLTSWLFTIVKNECMRLLGRARRASGDDSAIDGVLASCGDIELAIALNQALLRLEPELREVVLLRDVQELTGPEVAARLDLTLEAMKSRLHRARERLRVELAAEVERPS